MQINCLRCQAILDISESTRLNKLICPGCGKPPLIKGAKFDVGKPRFDLLPPEALFEIAKLYTFGAQKYEDNNWRKGIEYSRVFAALQRHAWAWWNGEEFDPEHGLSHLTAVAWCAMTLLSYSLGNYTHFDDRRKNAGPLVEDADKSAP